MESALPRRAWLGVELEPPSESVGPGVVVAAVHATSPAGQAGVRPGDRLVALGPHAIGGQADVTSALAALGAAATTGVDIERSGAALTLEVQTTPMPLERFEHAELRLETVALDEHRLRALYALPLPAVAAPPPWPAVVLLPGLSPGTVEHPFEPGHPLLRIVDGLARAGFVTLRVERSGLGDSEGPPCADGDLEQELATCQAGLDALGRQAFVVPERRFVFGYSVGGMIAPVVAHREGLRGVAVFGASARRWADCIASTSRRQLVLRGATSLELEERVGLITRMQELVCRAGLTPAQAFERHAELGVLRSAACHDDRLFGRAVAFFRQLDALDLPRAWRELDSDVLALHGEHDAVASLEEAEEIATLAGAGRARAVEIAGVGHDLLRHADAASALFTPAGRPDSGVLDALVAWLASR